MLRNSAFNRSSAREGCLASRKSTDSGSRQITMGIITSEAIAPNKNADRQPCCAINTAAIEPPIVAPIGYPMT